MFRVLTFAFHINKASFFTYKIMFLVVKQVFGLLTDLYLHRCNIIVWCEFWELEMFETSKTANSKLSITTCSHKLVYTLGWNSRIRSELIYILFIANKIGIYITTAWLTRWLLQCLLCSVNHEGTHLTWARSHLKFNSVGNNLKPTFHDMFYNCKISFITGSVCAWNLLVLIYSACITGITCIAGLFFSRPVAF